MGDPGSEVTVRQARRDEVPAVVRMLADDRLGSTREAFAEPLPQGYWDAFDAIEADPRNLLLVAAVDGLVVGTLQLTFIPNLTFLGGERAHVEGVRVDGSRRGAGIGRTLLTYAIELARDRGCRMVQLTANKERPDALRLYESLGFTAAHEGLKLMLGPSSVQPGSAGLVEEPAEADVAAPGLEVGGQPGKAVEQEQQAERTEQRGADERDRA
ncbi:MAG: GCN5-related N-acetyltransferase [Actinomycetia bacterium]|nr:GCN5-related N-acetyltransferase [Actinomycetes bacterium]